MASWIREHFRTFVWPALEATQQVDGPILPKRPGIPLWVSVLSRFSADSTLPFPELRILQTFCKTSMGNCSSCRSVPALCRCWVKNSSHGAPWTPLETWRRVRNAFDSAVSQAKDRPLLLAGRDVWAFKVLAERHRVRAIYIPVISRSVANNERVLRKVLKDHGVTGNELLVDTGFMGSIPRAISGVLGKELEFSMISQNPLFRVPRRVTGTTIDRLPNQVFPNMKGSRALALWLEYLPKYFRTGRVQSPVNPDARTVDVRNGEAVQNLSSPKEIVAAAVLTSCIWHGIADWTKVHDTIYN